VPKAVNTPLSNTYKNNNSPAEERLIYIVKAAENKLKQLLQKIR